MAKQVGPDELRAEYQAAMGSDLGDVFHFLMQDLAHLHLKWNEYVALFGTSEARVATLNRAAPEFFRMVQDAWWNDLILTIFRMTDSNPLTLSVRRLKPLAKVDIRDDLQARIDCGMRACRFAHRIRHVDIGHRNAEIAMKVQPLPPSSRADIKAAIKALDDVLEFVNHAYTGDEPVIWDYIDAYGGAEALMWIVQRGLKARDDDHANGVPPMRFPD